MACNTDLICCGHNNYATPQEFYFANIALLCAINASVQAGGATTDTTITWEVCFQYLPDGGTELVTFTRRFTEELETHVVTTYDFDKTTGDTVIVPVDAVLSVCPDCCATTTEEPVWLTASDFGVDPSAADFEIIPAPGAGFKIVLRYLSMGMASNTPDTLTFLAGGTYDYYSNFYLQGTIFATRLNKDDYLELDENYNLAIYSNDQVANLVNYTVEYKIVAV